MLQYAPSVSAKHYPKKPEYLPLVDAVILHKRYRETGDTALRNEIVMGCMAMLTALAKTHAVRSEMDVTDLLQEAVIGFTKGLDSIPKNVRNIYAYARKSAINALMDFEYGTKTTIKVSRHSHKLVKKHKDKVREAARHHEVTNIAPDALMNDYEPADRAGLMLLLGPNHIPIENGGTETKAPQRETVTEWQKNQYKSVDAPDDTEPAEHKGDIDLVRSALRELPEPARSIVFGYYGLAPKDFAALCRNWNVSASDAARIARGSLQSVRTAVGL